MLVRISPHSGTRMQRKQTKGTDNADEMGTEDEETSRLRGET